MKTNIHATQAKEGKIELIADTDGVLTVDSRRMQEINAIKDIMIASRKGGFSVKKGEKLAGTRIIPLVIKKDKMTQAQNAAGSEPLINVFPFIKKRAGVITTGNEVFYGRIKDTFTPVIDAKLAEFGCAIEKHVTLDDSNEKITAAINEMLDSGMDLVICTGGMSVDADDQTPLAIRNSGVNIVSYGAPVLPGAMFLLSYAEDGQPVVGLPGCVMYAKRTIFDLVLPSIMAGVPITAEQLSNYGEGGLCLECDECHFPNCSFGK
jgi:molybdenum cofactor synthesis domain-containing protein